MAEFLATASLGEPPFVTDLAERRNALLGSLLYLGAPDVRVFCSSQVRGGCGNLGRNVGFSGGQTSGVGRD